MACHLYSDRILDLDGCVESILGIELMKSSPQSGPNFAIELNTNWYIPRLNRSELNWEAFLRLGLTRGLTGFVPYPYAASRVSYKDNIEGTDYYESTCLNLQGEPTEAYWQFKRFNL